MQLLQEIDILKELLDTKDQLAEDTKSNNKEIKEVKERISKMMIDEEVPRISRNGFVYTLQEKVTFSKKSEEALAELDLVFMDVLREQGLGDLIVEKVDPRTLSSAIKGIIEEQGELSEELAEVITSYETYDIAKRKESNKAAKNAKKDEE